MATLGVVKPHPDRETVKSTGKEQQQGKGVLAAAAIIGVFTLVYFRSVLLYPGGMVYSPLSDLVGQTFGWKMLIRDTLWGSGALPLWNPHLMCGYPILGNLNYALLFPMHLLYLLLPTGPAASWTYLLTHFCAAMAAWYFLRVIGVRNRGAIIGGLAYRFGVRNMGHLTNGFVGHLETLPFLPLAFACTARLAVQRNWRHVAALALVLAVILFSAFAQIFLYLMFILPLYFAWLVHAGKEDRRWLLSGLQFALAVTLACGLAAAHLLPAVQLLPELSRSSEMAPELYRLGSLPLRHFFTLVNPELFGRIGPQWSYFGSAYFWTLTFYTPLFLLPLAFLSFCQQAGRRQRTFFVALIPALLLFAMGTYGPVYDFCHRFIPGVSLFREPARILFFFPLAMAVLAGLGWDGLRQVMDRGTKGERRQALWLVAGAALLISLLAAGYAVYHDGAAEIVAQSFEVSAAFFGGGAGRAAAYAEQLEQLLPKTVAASLVFFCASFGLLFFALKRGPLLKSDSLQGLALLILAADLLFFGRGYLATADSEQLFLQSTPLVQRLVDLQDGEQPFRVADLSGALSDNQACVFGIDKAGGYDPINLKVTQRRFDALNRREEQSSVAWTLRVEPGFRRELLDKLNVRYLVSREPLTQKGLQLVETFEPLPVTLQNYGQVRLPGVRLYRNNRAFPRAWFVPGPVSPDPAGGTDLAFTAATVIAREPNRLLIEADCTGAGMLVVSQAWSKGWKADLLGSGEPLTVCLVDDMLTGVMLDRTGKQQVRLFYRPPGLWAGMAISTISLLGLAALVLAGGRPGRPPSQTAQRRAVEEETDGDQHELVHKGDRVDPQQVEHQQEIDGDGQGKEQG